MPVSAPGPVPGAPPSGARASAWLLLLPAAALWIGTALNKSVNPDESQHLQAAWLVGQGAVPFADFWEHHTPLLYYGLAPLTRWFVESPAVYLAGRALMVIAAGTALLLVGTLARRLSGGAAFAAVALLVVLPRFIERATEVRPDVPALVAWLGAMLAMVRWRERGGAARLWTAGLLVGVATSFTPKTLYAGAGLGLAVAVAERGAGLVRVRRAAVAWARFAGGAGVPLLALLIALWLHGGGRALDGFAEHVMARSLDFADFTKEGPVTDEGLGFLTLAAAGVLLVLRKYGWGVFDHPLHGPLLLPAAGMAVVLLLPTTPAVYRHAWLPILAVAGIYAGQALATVLGHARARRPVAIALAAVSVLAGLLGPVSVSSRKAFSDGNSHQFRLMRLELAHTCPAEPVLDGTALYVFRPAAHRYRVLTTDVRQRIATGVISEEWIVNDVRTSRPRLAYDDQRLRGLVGPMAQFLSRHYVRTADGLLVAGAAIRVAPPRERGRAEIDLLLGETYRLTAGPGVSVMIDGRPEPPGLVQLGAGRHVVHWTGPVGTIELTTLSCAERQGVSEHPRALAVSVSHATVSERLPARAFLAPTPSA